ncbi:MAG TPA: hypothetical protein VFH01_03020 [Pyrinomonadaceae bacterium]|nr:hypothetical protein [Pyrinomonadaceae bacterium]
MEAVVEQAGTDLSAVVLDLVSKVSRVTARIFGCWHVNLSRPFSRGNETYRTCVACGARRRFDLEHWEMVGSFYYPERNFGLLARMR